MSYPAVEPTPAPTDLPTALADLVDVGCTPPKVLAGNTRHLSRIEAFERGEIIRVLATQGLTMAEVAHELGMSHATRYRMIAPCDIDVPRHGH